MLLSQKQQVKTLGQLKKLASADGGRDFFILLNHDFVSRKHISFDGKQFQIWNAISSTWQTLNEKEIMQKAYGLLGEAMKKGKLFTD